MTIASNSMGGVPGDGGASRFTWINAAVLIASDVTTTLVGVESLSQATLLLNVTAASGTSPTLNVYLQKLLADGTTWQDIAAFSQVTGVTKRILHMVTGGNKEEAASAKALTAGTVNAVPFGAMWRIATTIGGTNPSFTVTLSMEGIS